MAQAILPLIIELSCLAYHSIIPSNSDIHFSNHNHFVYKASNCPSSVCSDTSLSCHHLLSFLPSSFSPIETTTTMPPSSTTPRYHCRQPCHTTTALSNPFSFFSSPSPTETTTSTINRHHNIVQPPSPSPSSPSPLLPIFPKL